MKRLTILFHGRFRARSCIGLRCRECPFAFGILRRHHSGSAPPRHRSRGPVRCIRVTKVCTSHISADDRSVRVPILTHAAFAISLIAFSFSCFWHLRNAARDEWVESNDLLVGLVAACAPPRLFYEVHDFPERWRMLYRWLFSRTTIILATNQ